jgi:hypothetical protein
MDARNRVHDLARASRSGKDFEPFDFVYGDAFNDFSVPFHLVTREFTEKIRDVLRPETGVYMVNIIDIYASSRFVGAVYNTAREVFPHAYVLVTSAGGPSDEWDQRDTFVVVGAFQPLDLEKLGTREGDTAFEGTLLGAEHLGKIRERSEERVLTDDHSPVENLLEVVVRGRAHKPSEENEEE